LTKPYLDKQRTMQNVAPVLSALASVCWVAFAFTALLLFRREISRTISRVRKGKVLGQELELSEELKELAISASAAISATPLKQDQEPGAVESGTEQQGDGDEVYNTIRWILNQAATSPKVALVSLYSELERQARHAVASRGLLRNRSNIPMKQALGELAQYGFPPNMANSLKLFADVRKKLVHGQTATDDDVLQAIDSGLSILKAMVMLPNGMNIVYNPGVDVFSDSECTSTFPQTRGLILETTSPGGAIKSYRVFPTTKNRLQKREAGRLGMEQRTSLAGGLV
jgi:hypothetical protein